ncbi:MAG: helix-turn-helix transcriptional regulator [Chthoniobacteraceae bacterium]|nr:helix-turn-helix transcriptional regulator [Chthoniobacteraceae bacterium]
MSLPSFAERCRVYRGILRSFLPQRGEKPPKIHIPRLAGLRRQHPGMMFHLDPELFLQASGSTEFSCPEDRFTLRRNEIAIIPRGVPHGEVARERRGSRFRALVFCFHGHELTLIVSRSSPDSRPTVVFCDSFEGPEVPQALRYLEDAAAASLKTSPTGEARRRALVFAVLSVMDDLLASARLAHRAQSHEHPKVRHCHDLIQALLPEPQLSVASLAGQLGCTPDHLSRCFRAETGMPVSAYIRNQRLARAKGLLQDPKLNVSEIAWACGFSSLNYFVRAFRQAMGQPPRRFQRTLAPAAPTREG